MERRGLLGLEKQYAFFKAYQRNPVNILPPWLSVWPVVFTFLLLLYFTPCLPSFGHWDSSPFVDSQAMVLCLACWVWSSFLARRRGFSLAWKVVLVSQFVCWTGEALGHSLFEKRAPSDNILQPLLTTPFLVFLEVLQAVFHYKPYEGFNASVRKHLEAQIKEWEEKQQCKTL